MNIIFRINLLSLSAKKNLKYIEEHNVILGLLFQSHYYYYYYYFMVVSSEISRVYLIISNVMAKNNKL